MVLGLYKCAIRGIRIAGPITLVFSLSAVPVTTASLAVPIKSGVSFVRPNVCFLEQLRCRRRFYSSHSFD